MENSESRIQQLQQIPVFALRKMTYKLLDDEKSEQILRERFGAILNRKLKNLKHAVQRMNREQITSLIDICPEITDAQIKELFEDYRYGSNPAFYVHLFDKSRLARDALQGFRQRFENQLDGFNIARDEGLPRMRNLALNDLVSLPERPEIIEATYRFQTRLDYIDASQNAISTYQTQYGFFWLNASEGYVIIHARNAEALKVLRRAIEKGADIQLAALVISKQLKNALPFLIRDSFRSGRLHDPNPGPGRFRWLTVADENPYAKGYQQLEERYPEVRSVRYKEVIDGEKETTLTIRCDRGSLSLGGTLNAKQFRAWTLDRLGQLVRVLNEFRPNAPAYVHTRNLSDVPELSKFSPAQRHSLMQIISALLTVKQSPIIGYQALKISPSVLAAGMGDCLRVQIPLQCSDTDSDNDSYLACPTCDATTFSLKSGAEHLHLECREHQHQPWAVELPLLAECGWQEDLVLDGDELDARLELLPDEQLVDTISDVVNRHLPGYTFEAQQEGFIIRGPNLVYYPDKSRMNDSEYDDAKTIIYVTQHINNLNGGEVVGVGAELEIEDASLVES